ncbi:tripartite tricarboxylate transporter substrate-binding protein [Bradyrhizobium sp.]|uniref:tripartite tricarboxylate transporter substrate-binding protein n=1 Tax=Bradyrhizobium sp. TaxID=376 RepID=UPI003BB160C2
MVAQSLFSSLGHSVIVENQSGAGGRIGAKVVATAPSDGYTLLLGGSNVNAITGAIYRNLGFDPIKSFAPIAAIYADSLALALCRTCRPTPGRSLSNTRRIIPDN